MNLSEISNKTSLTTHRLEFGNDMSRLVRGLAVVLMVIGHSLPGKIIPFAVPLFSFLVGYGYYFAKQKTISHAAKRVWHLLSHFWLILFGICIPAALITWAGEIKIGEVLLNMFGLCGRFNFYCWYIYFYVAAMLLMPIVSRAINKRGLWATLLIAALFGGIAGSIYLWANSYLTTGSPNVVSVLYRVCRYMPVVVMGYWLAYSKFFSKISLRKNIWAVLSAIAILIGVYMLRGVPYMMLADLIWAPVAAGALAVVFNIYALPFLRIIITELGLKSMGIWFLHAVFFTHSTRGLFLPLIKWIPLNNWMPDLLWLPKGSLRIPVIIVLSYFMAWGVELAYNLIKKGGRRVSTKLAIPTLLPVIALFITTGCTTSENASSTYGEPVYTPDYANGFSITGMEGRQSVALVSINPWQGADNVTESLLILRNNESTPEGWSGQVLKGNAKRIVTTSSTHIAFIDALGESGRIVGVSGKQFVSSPSIIARADSIADIGYDNNVDYERLISLKPDLVMLYGVNGESVMEKKLRELGIPFIYIGDYTEDTPLGKAEWLIPVGELLGKEELAKEVYSQIPERYNNLANQVKSNAAAKPKVIISTPQADAWLMPSTNSYVAALVRDAGGEYLYTKNTGNASRPVDLEEAMTLASAADVWIDTGMVSTLSELRDACPKFAGIPVIKKGEVYNNNFRETPAGGNDYYESGVVNPDIILLDLITIFHPELGINHNLYYYHKLK